MKLTSDDREWSELQRRLRGLARLPVAGDMWATAAGKRLKAALIESLDEQGRGGSGEPLSSEYLATPAATEDNTKIRESLKVDLARYPTQSSAKVYIQDALSEKIARVQNEGAVIARSTSEGTARIYVPGRRFWDSAVEREAQRAKRELKRIVRQTFR